MSVTLLWILNGRGVELSLDATLSETHTLESTATTNPVEDGVAVSDHLRLQPRAVSVQGIIANTPVKLEAGKEYPRGQAGRASAAYETLRKLRESKQLVTLVTALGHYPNMMMTSLVIPRERQGEALQFTAQFRELILVRTQTVQLPKAKKPRGKPPVKDGKKATPEAPAAGTRESVANVMLDLSGILKARGQ